MLQLLRLNARDVQQLHRQLSVFRATNSNGVNINNLTNRNTLKALAQLTLKDGLIFIFLNLVFTLLADLTGVEAFDPALRRSGVAVALPGADRV